MIKDGDFELPGIKEWLLKWFEQKNCGEDAKLAAGSDINYFEAKWIDSFGVIELIESIELTFEVAIEDEYFQDPRFVTLDGLSEIIYELKIGNR